MARKKPTAIISPNLGLYITRPNIAVPDRALQDGLNFRIHFGKIEDANLGWVRFDNFTLDGPVRLIDNFFPRAAGEALIFATETSLYQFIQGQGVRFLNPRFEEGTVTADPTAGPDGTVLTFSEDITDIVLPGDFIHFGTAGQTDPDELWYEVFSVLYPNTVVVDGLVDGAHTAATPFTVRHSLHMGPENWWSTTEFISGAALPDYWIGTNGVDWVLSWDGVEDQAVFQTGMNFKCKALRTYKNMVIYANLEYLGDLLPTQMINSDVGQPFNAGDDGTGLSEQLTVHSGSDEIFALSPLADTLIHYSERHAIAMDFVGDPEVFSFRRAIVGYGPMGPGCIAEFSSFHRFLGADAMYHFDGVASNEIDEHFWPEMIRQHDPVRRVRIFCHFNEQFSELMWAVPLTMDTGSGTITSPAARAQVLHYQEPVEEGLPEPYSRRTFPFTAAGYYARQSAIRWSDLIGIWAEQNFRWNDSALSKDYPLTLVGDVDGKIYILNAAQSGDGVALPSFARFGRKAIVDGKARGLIKRVYPFVEQFGGSMKITVNITDHNQGPITIVHTDIFDMLLPPELYFTSPFRRGRYMDLEVATITGGPWFCSGYDVDAAPGGRR